MKWIFYDFNGTILDDVNLCLSLLNEFLASENKKTHSVEEYKEIFCFPVKKYYEKAGVEFKEKSFEEMSEIFIKAYQPASYSCSVYPNLVETVKELKQRGYKVGVLSASQIDNLNDQLTKLAIKDMFDVVLGLDNIYAASKIAVAKDFMAANNIQGSDVLFIGDTIHDFEVANAIGSKAILYSGGHQSRRVLEGTKCQIINDHKEVLAFLD